MKLAQWRKEEGWTQGKLAAEIGCSQSYISQIERAIDPIIPSSDVLRSIYVVSRGKVQPNDFYDVPAWEADRIRCEAEAELARRAA